MRDRRGQMQALREELWVVRNHARASAEWDVVEAVAEVEGRLSVGDADGAVRLLMGWTLARRLSPASPVLSLR